MKRVGLFLTASTCMIILCCSKVIENENDGGNMMQEDLITFSSSPIRTIEHNREYDYHIRASSFEGNKIDYSVSIPSWLTYDSTTNRIRGIADWANVNKSFNIAINATSVSGSATQSYSLSVSLGEIICGQDFGEPTSSHYILPYDAGNGYKLSQGYCPSNPAWGHHNWFAYDFDTPIGTPIIASRSGEVIGIRSINPDVPENAADCSGGKENYVFILHKDGTVMSYVHLTENGVAVKVGDHVNQGDLIGYSGNSGCTIGPHTHIALFKDRTNYDRQSTIPFNYSNTDGTLDSNNGLVEGEVYDAF